MIGQRENQMSVVTICQHRLRRALLAALSLSLLALFAPSAAHAAFPGANGRIAWTSNEGGTDSEIVSTFADGSTFTQHTTNSTDDREPAWSPDGTKIAYAHFNTTSGFWEIWIKDLVGGTETPWVTEASVGGADVTDPTWRRDGARIAFTLWAGNRSIYRADTNAANTNVQPVVTGFDNIEPAYAPNSNKIAFARSVNGSPFALDTVNDDGTSLTPLVSNGSFQLNRPNWSPDGSKVAYQLFNTAPPVLGDPPNYDLWTVNANGTGAAQIFYTAADELDPAWAPEGNMIAYERAAPAGSSDHEVYTINPNGTGSRPVATRAATSDGWPDWQAVNGYARPKGATPLYLPLVPAFNQCTSGNATHGTPPAFPSCVPPKASSRDLTVGEPGVNGKVANMIGSVKIKAIAGDASLTVSVTDVRCAHAIDGACANPGGPLSDYVGNISLNYVFRLTDRSNTAGSGGRAGTVTNLNLPVPVGCAATDDTSVGSTCGGTTTFNTILPGMVVAGRRAIWRYLLLALRDANGNDFAVPGTFYP